MVIDPAGPPCYCGARGCVETFISGGGLEKAFLAHYGAALSATDIHQQALTGDSRCQAVMADFYARFGQAIANLIAVLDPDVIVLGGGLSNIDGLYTEGVEQVRARVFSDELTTPIVRNELGDSAGVIGAALLGI
jgi:fructokinase